MRTILYGKKAANLYTQAFVQNTQARALYQESEDTYYQAGGKNGKNAGFFEKAST